jgi:drug/metabolite transporter (DMT)-like permease
MGYVCALAAFLIWGVNSTVILRLLPVGAPVATFLGAVSAMTFSWVGIGRRGRIAAMKLTREHTWRLASQIAAFASTSMTYQMSIKQTSIANAALTHALMPLFACMLLEPLIYRNRPSRREAAAVMIGLAGMAVLLLPQLSWKITSTSMWGIILGTISAVCYAWSIMNQSRFPASVPRDAELALVLTGASLLMLPFALHAGIPQITPRLAGSVALFGFLGFFLANRLYMHALQSLSVASMSTLSYIEPVAAIIVAAIWLAEPITVNGLIGGAMILGSSALVMIKPKRAVP